MVDWFTFFDEFILLWVCDNRNHSRPHFELIVDFGSQQIDQSHKLFYFLQSWWKFDLDKGLQLHIKNFLNCSSDLKLFNLFVDWLILNCVRFSFFTDQCSHNTLFIFWFFQDRHLLLHLLLLVPRSVVSHYLRVVVDKIIFKEVLPVAIFNSFENVVLRVEVVACPHESGWVWVVEPVVLVFLEKEV